VPKPFALFQTTAAVIANIVNTTLLATIFIANKLLNS